MVNKRAVRAGVPYKAPSRALLTDYHVYVLGKGERFVAILMVAIGIFVTVCLFYRSPLIATCCLPLAAFGPRFRAKKLKNQRQDRLKQQFKELLFAVSSSLAAGRSVQNAFLFAADELKLLYADERTEILQELKIITTRIQSGESLEDAVADFARRSHIAEIEQFASTLATCRKSGGNLVEVMKRTSVIIAEKLETEQEITVMIAQKKFEASIMQIMPLFFLGFMQMVAPDYMQPLYSGLGYVVITVALLLLLACYWLTHRIMSIEM